MILKGNKQNMDFLQVFNLQLQKISKLLLFGFSLFLLKLSAQTSSWNQLCHLDQKMIHSSGILTLNEGKTFWTQVDNSSPAEIYEIDANCNVLRTLKINNVSKTDWEEIANDDQGTIYIGDFGNNNNDRTNLRIYILKNVIQNVSDSITPEIIKFRYANQSAFPPPSSEQNFDMEAMIWYHDSLHLFSKNRTSPFTGYTYQYAMPAIPGDYILSPVDSFKTGDGPMLFFWITAAAFNSKDKQLILLSHDRFWIFTDFEASRFFQGNSKLITLPTYTQKEGICYATNNTWYLTDEYNSTIKLGGNLYEMKLDALSSSNENEITNFEIQPNPVSDFLQIITPKINDINEIRLLNFMGTLCKKFQINSLPNNIPLQGICNGIYYLQVVSKNLKCSRVKKIIVLK